MSTKRQDKAGRLRRLPNGKAGPNVRSSSGKYYMSLEDLLTYPELVHRRIVPEFGKIHVMHWGRVVLVVSLPESEEGAAESSGCRRLERFQYSAQHRVAVPSGPPFPCDARQNAAPPRS